jgi:hypothetical protein
MAWKNSKYRYVTSFIFSKSPIWLLRNTIGVKAGNPIYKRITVNGLEFLVSFFEIYY